MYISDYQAQRIREIVFKAVVNWPTPAPIAYGTALSSTQLDATSNVPGTFVYTPAAGTVLQPGIQTLSVTFTPSDTTDYSPVTATVQLIVESATADSGTITLTVNGILAATTDYGASSTPQSVASGLVAGVAPGSLVTLSVNPTNSATLLMTSNATGSQADYDYTLQTTAYNSQYFSQPSFVNPPLSGSLQGGEDVSTTPNPVYSYGLTYQPNGNLYSYTEPASGVSGYTNFVMGTWNSFSYDNLNRLAGAQGSEPGNPFTNYCWSYDNWGNRAQQVGSNESMTGGGGATCQWQSNSNIAYTWQNYSSSNNNQLVATSQGNGSVQYDAAGDETSDGTNTYLYDADGHICAVNVPQYDAPSIMMGYIYDADGNRVAKGNITSMSCDPSVNGFTATASYVLDQSGHQLTEVDAETNGITPWHTNVYANGSLMATYDNNEVHFELNDWLGTRRLQTNYAGVTEMSFQSLPFGDSLTSIPNPACLPANQCYAEDPTENHFTGKERDAESGNDYFKYRYYASSMGRWLSPDPSGLMYASRSDPQSFNLYSYVGNNPLTRVDLLGLCWKGFKWACDVWQRVRNLAAGDGFHTDDENTLHPGKATQQRINGSYLKETGQATPPNTPKPPDGGCSMEDPGCQTWYQWYLQHRRNPYVGYSADGVGMLGTFFHIPLLGYVSAGASLANKPSYQNAITTMLGLAPEEGAAWPTTLFVDGFDYGINHDQPAESRLGYGDPFVDDGGSTGSSNGGGLPSGTQGGATAPMTQEECQMTLGCN